MRVEGRDGVGRKAKVPWVRIFDPVLSPSATDGYYVVLLFARDGSGVYLSLNQGTTIFKDDKHIKRPADKILANSRWAQKELQDQIKLEPKLRQEILLADPKGLGEIYQVGNIAAIKYLPNELPTGDQLGEDMSLMLRLLDRLYEVSSGIPSVEQLPLRTVREGRRAYTAADATNDLFLPPNQIDEILRLILRKHNVVLQGPPGVGKTFAANRIAGATVGEEKSGRIEWVQFHQSYSYEDFVEGFKPDKAGGFLLSEGLFCRFCKLAAGDLEKKFVLVIDEINRGNLSKIFGEMLSLVEGDKRGSLSVTLPYSGQAFTVPPNLYILGLMNTADRSLAVVDYALRRRFVFVDLEPQFDSLKFAEYLMRMNVDEETITKIRSRMAELNAKIGGDFRNLGKGFEIGHSFFSPSSPVHNSSEWYDDVIRYEVMPLLREYWFDSPREVESAEAILRR